MKEFLFKRSRVDRGEESSFSLGFPQLSGGKILTALQGSLTMLHAE